MHQQALDEEAVMSELSRAMSVELESVLELQLLSELMIMSIHALINMIRSRLRQTCLGVRFRLHPRRLLVHVRAWKPCWLAFTTPLRSRILQ